MTGCTVRRYDQLETSTEMSEQELRPAVCEHRQTDRHKENYSIVYSSWSLVGMDHIGKFTSTISRSISFRSSVIVSHRLQYIHLYVFLFLCMSVLPSVPLSLSLILIICQCHAFLIVCVFLLLCCPNFTDSFCRLASRYIFFLRTQLFSVGALCALASSSHSFSQQCYKCVYKTFLR